MTRAVNYTLRMFIRYTNGLVVMGKDIYFHEVFSLNTNAENYMDSFPLSID